MLHMYSFKCLCSAAVKFLPEELLKTDRKNVHETQRDTSCHSYNLGIKTRNECPKGKAHVLLISVFKF